MRRMAHAHGLHACLKQTCVHACQTHYKCARTWFACAVQAGNSVTRLVVPSLELQSDQHADTPWPWEALRVDKPNITDLCKLPDPAGQRAVRVLCRDVYIDSSVLQVR